MHLRQIKRKIQVDLDLFKQPVNPLNKIALDSTISLLINLRQPLTLLLNRLLTIKALDLQQRSHKQTMISLTILLTNHLNPSNHSSLRQRRMISSRRILLLQRLRLPSQRNLPSPLRWPPCNSNLWICSNRMILDR